MTRIADDLQAALVLALGTLPAKTPVSRKKPSRSVAECRVCSARSLWPPIEGVRVVACPDCQLDAIADFTLVEGFTPAGSKGHSLNNLEIL